MQYSNHNLILRLCILRSAARIRACATTILHYIGDKNSVMISRRPIYLLDTAVQRTACQWRITSYSRHAPLIS